MPHRHARGANVGLTDALGKILDQQFSARRKADGKFCEGEEVCRLGGTPHKKQGLRELKSPGSTKTPEEICSACDLFPTKPGNMPAHLSALVVVAHRMEALFESHAGSSYPVEFTPLEWEAFLTLKYARAKDDEKRMPASGAAKPGSDDWQAQEQARLRARLGQG